MTIRRRAAVIGAVVAGLASLAACDKPSPYTTITVGSDSVHSEAVCYNDGRKLSDSTLRDCLRKRPTETIKVKSGEQVRLGIDKAVAETGWFLAVNGQPVTEPVTDTYASFNGDAFFANRQSPGGESLDDVMVTIVEAKKDREGSYGVWTYKLKLG